MFNFFEEIKSKTKNQNMLDTFQIINMSNKILYAEGHKGLVSLSKELISFKVKGRRIVVEGEEMFLLELTENTIKISGKIKKLLDEKRFFRLRLV